MIKVNLVPAEVLIEEQKKRRAVQAAAVGVVLMMILAGVTFLHWNKARSLTAQLHDNQEKLKKLAKVVEQVKQLEATAAAVRSRLSVIQNLLTGRFLYPVFMEDWIRSLPSGVWLRSLNTTGSGSGLGISISAQARRQEDIAEWLRTLEGGSNFGGLELGAISRSGPEGDVTLSFTLKSNYTFTPPKELEEP